MNFTVPGPDSLRKIAVTLVDERSKRVMAWLQQLLHSEFVFAWNNCRLFRLVHYSGTDARRSYDTVPTCWTS
jgi:hypothetical protein